MSEPEDSGKLLILKRVNAARGVYVIWSDYHAMVAHLSGSHLSTDLTPNDVKEVLESADVNYGIVEDTISAVCAAAKEGQDVDRLLIAQGLEMVEGEDGRLDFLKQPTGQLVSTAEGSEEKVDFREMKRFDNVQAGDLVARLVPPRPGKAGVDIHNKVVPVPRVSEIEVEPGENIRFEPDRNEFFALSKGHLRYERDKLWVDPVYNVSGHVDMSQGNIRFIGRVEVTGDILDDFEVSAAEGLVVGGTVEAASLVSGEDIEIHGGITGKGRGKVRCKGKLSARYINEADVVAEGDVHVVKEIINSHIFTLGRVVIERGAIVGSEVVALKGVLARDIGSDLGVKTSVAAGLHYKAYEKLIAMNRELHTLQEKQQELLHRVGPMLEGALRGAGADKKHLEELDETLPTIRQQQKAILKLDKVTGEIFRRFEKSAVACISVARTVYPSVSLVVGKYEHNTQTPLTGPLSVIPDEDRRTAELCGGLLAQGYWDGDSAPETKSLDTGKEKGGADKAAADKRQKGRRGKEWTFEQVDELYRRLRPNVIDGEGRRLLVAEDQAIMRKLFVDALKKRNFKVIEAEDGLDALRKIKAEVPEVCILDVAMPRLTGFDVLEAMRKDFTFRATPVIIVSALKEKKDVLLAHKLGAQGYMIKPIQVDDLIKKVAEVLPEMEEEEDESIFEGIGDAPDAPSAGKPESPPPAPAESEKSESAVDDAEGTEDTDETDDDMDDAGDEELIL